MKKFLTTIAAAAAMTFLPVAAVSAGSSYGGHKMDYDKKAHHQHDYGKKYGGGHGYSPLSIRRNDLTARQAASANEWQNRFNFSHRETTHELLAVQILYVNETTSSTAVDVSSSDSGFNEHSAVDLHSSSVVR